MIDTPTPGRRSRWTVPVLAAVAVLAIVAVGILLARTDRGGPGPLSVAPLPPASAGVGQADYVGSRWRLTTVTDGHGTTKMPKSVDAWIELSADGGLLASDDVNVTDATFRPTGTGFDCFGGLTTLVGDAGGDRAQLAAMMGIEALTTDAAVMAAQRSNASPFPPARPVHVTVLSVDRGHLSVQAGGVRLAFVRSGPVKSRPPLASSAPEPT